MANGNGKNLVISKNLVVSVSFSVFVLFAVSIFSLGGIAKEVKIHIADDGKHPTFEDLVKKYGFITFKEVDLMISPVTNKVDRVEDKVDKLVKAIDGS